jgi:hypothetical protein
MKSLKKTLLGAGAGFLALGALGLASELGLPGVSGVIPTAEAVVGRPLTPMSVAGVGRRTVRRCAVGVYYC